MPTIRLCTEIEAPITRVFDLCRSIEAHVATAAGTDERPVSGVTTGLMQLGEQVTWSARHLGRRWLLTSRITLCERPHRFRDSQVKGVFVRFDHDHEFEARGTTTIVRDVFDFTSPCGVLGRIADVVVVTRHLRRFLHHRMNGIKAIAESTRWQQFVASDGAP